MAPVGDYNIWMGALFTYLCVCIVCHLNASEYPILPRWCTIVYLYIGMSRIFLISFRVFPVSTSRIPCSSFRNMTFSYESVQILFVLQNLTGKQYFKYFKNRTSYKRAETALIDAKMLNEEYVESRMWFPRAIQNS